MVIATDDDGSIKSQSHYRDNTNEVKLLDLLKRDKLVPVFAKFGQDGLSKHENINTLNHELTTEHKTLVGRSEYKALRVYRTLREDEDQLEHKKQPLKGIFIYL